MAHLLITRSVSRHRTLRGSAFPIRMHIGKFFSMVVLALLIGGIGSFYLAEFTKVHTKGYQVRKLELEREDLMANRESHAVDIAKEKALVSVRDAAISLNMVAAKQITYLQEDSAVAQAPSVVLGQLN